MSSSLQKYLGFYTAVHHQSLSLNGVNMDALGQSVRLVSSGSIDQDQALILESQLLALNGSAPAKGKEAAKMAIGLAETKAQLDQIVKHINSLPQKEPIFLFSKEWFEAIPDTDRKVFWIDTAKGREKIIFLPCSALNGDFGFLRLTPDGKVVFHLSCYYEIPALFKRIVELMKQPATERVLKLDEEESALLEKIEKLGEDLSPIRDDVTHKIKNKAGNVTNIIFNGMGGAIILDAFINNIKKGSCRYLFPVVEGSRCAIKKIPQSQIVLEDDQHRVSLKKSIRSLAQISRKLDLTWKSSIPADAKNGEWFVLTDRPMIVKMRVKSISSPYDAPARDLLFTHKNENHYLKVDVKWGDENEISYDFVRKNPKSCIFKNHGAYYHGHFELTPSGLKISSNSGLEAALAERFFGPKITAEEVISEDNPHLVIRILSDLDTIDLVTGTLIMYWKQFIPNAFVEFCEGVTRIYVALNPENRFLAGKLLDVTDDVCRLRSKCALASDVIKLIIERSDADAEEIRQINCAAQPKKLTVFSKFDPEAKTLIGELPAYCQETIAWLVTEKHIPVSVISRVLLNKALKEMIVWAEPYFGQEIHPAIPVLNLLRDLHDLGVEGVESAFDEIKTNANGNTIPKLCIGRAEQLHGFYQEYKEAQFIARYAPVTSVVVGRDLICESIVDGKKAVQSDLIVFYSQEKRPRLVEIKTTALDLFSIKKEEIKEHLENQINRICKAVIEHDLAGIEYVIVANRTDDEAIDYLKNLLDATGVDYFLRCHSPFGKNVILASRGFVPTYKEAPFIPAPQDLTASPLSFLTKMQKSKGREHLRPLYKVHQSKRSIQKIHKIERALKQQSPRGLPLQRIAHFQNNQRLGGLSQLAKPRS